MNKLTNSNCIRGWIEILHFKWDSILHAEPKIYDDVSLENFKEDHYELVGSPLPLSEYYSAFEVYKQFAGNIDKDINIPRPFRNYDAINLCLNDPRYDNSVTTLMVLPKGKQHHCTFHVGQPQYDNKHRHCLLKLEKPFDAFFPRLRNNGK
jgi:hypothetical protein